jgi:hypothetical protein
MSSVTLPKKGRSANPAHPAPHIGLASAYGLKGESELAAAELAEARRSAGNPDNFSSITRIRTANKFWAPTIVTLLEATFYVGLRKAGMPEE